MEDLDAQIARERAARREGAALTEVSMDLDLYGAAPADQFSHEVVEDTEEFSSAAAGRAASLAQRVIASHGLEEAADGDAALRRFREAGGSAATLATVGSRESEVRGALCLRGRRAAVWPPPPPSIPPFPAREFMRPF